MARANITTAVQSPRYGDDWWQRGVVYQIYPRSFADSDGDGVGDLSGIIAHLDHLGRDGLGVDAIWLSPIYPSPGLDLGYDVSDHERVDPLFGSEADFDRLVDEAHRRGIRVVLDLVMNHTSDRHPWFVSSKQARTGPHADWYLWRDAAGSAPDGTPLPPNNWVSYFGGPGWEWVPERGQFYYHTFLVEQPELDWRTPAVEAAQFDMVRGWLARGVDGFRLDVFNAFLKHPDLPSNPVRPGRTDWERQIHVYDRDQEDFPELIARFRAILDDAPGRMSVSELFDGTVETAARLTAPRHLVFDWSLLESSWDGAALRAAIEAREHAFGVEHWPTAVLSNHDRSRQASRLASAESGADHDAVARAAAVLLLTQRGTPFLYYGEELGLGDVDIAPADSLDPPAARVGPGFDWWDRSRCRTPMPWTAEDGAGFSTASPWLPLGGDAATRNVASQAADPNSILSTYRQLIALRAASPALQVGSLAVHQDSGADVLAYTRNTDEQVALVLINTGRERVGWQLTAVRGASAWRSLFRTDGPTTANDDPIPNGTTLLLGPDDALVLEALR